MLTDKLPTILEESRNKRICRVTVGATEVWVKRHDTAPISFLKRLHGQLSFPDFLNFLNATPPASARQRIQREVHKTRSFQNKGFLAPEIHLWEDDFFISADVNPTVDFLLKNLPAENVQEHDELLIKSAEMLGRIHHAGLCHGRPHPRDMYWKNSEIGFFDFEEEPEASMPLATAQARDIWLFFLQVCSRQRHGDTPDKALNAYMNHAPTEVMSELKRMVYFFSLAIPALTIIKRFHLGKDGVRFLQAMTFLRNRV